ncbi:MAG: hypothetical protein HY062_09670 [Bacteroidetes bacterium]|nr:hypothetical protein [Bacteroidota bacterium]
MKSSYKITNLCFYAIVIIISVLVIGFPPHNTLCYDVFGYYMYLPLAFKYHDITIQDYSTITHLLDTYHASETFYQAVHWDNGNWVMRYPIGLSVLFTPFYFIGDIIARFTDYPTDGFSKPYQLSILYGCLIYTIIGLYFVKKILTHFFNDNISAITLFCIALGTNYLFHVSLHGQGAMSHNILFSLYAVIIYLTIQWHQTYLRNYMILLGLFIGISALCRPSEIISVLIPLCYGIVNLKSVKDKLQLLLHYKIQIIYFILVIFSVGFIQFAYWKYASGKFMINPYGAGNPGEGLELFHPHILEVLFSFRKGWFIYTPLMLFTVTGFIYMYRNNKPLFTPVFIYFIINFYIVSCWSCWWYGACFGVRSLIPSYAALSIPLGYCVMHILNSRRKYAYMAVIFLCIVLNLFQSWQLNAGIMDSTNMSRAYYFSTFLQTTSPTTEQKKLLLKGKFSDGIEVFTKDDSLTHSLAYASLLDFEKEHKHINPLFLCDTLKHTGKYSYVTNPQNPDSPAIEMMYKDISKKSYTWIKASVWLYSQYPADSINAVFSIELKHRGYTFKYKGYRLDNSNFKPNQWNKLEYYYLTPDDLRSKKDEVKTFFSNKSKYPVYVDDLLLESYEPIIDKSVF